MSFQGRQPFAGPVAARARLHGSGDSVHDAMGDAYGEMMVVAPGGQDSPGRWPSWRASM